jgi:hypothetical protein
MLVLGHGVRHGHAHDLGRGAGVLPAGQRDDVVIGRRLLHLVKQRVHLGQQPAGQLLALLLRHLGPAGAGGLGLLAVRCCSRCICLHACAHGPAGQRAAGDAGQPRSLGQAVL